MQGKHSVFQLRECGLIVNPKYPLFAASPDAQSQCECCGKGCVEIKCPYCIKDGQDFREILKLKDPYLLLLTEKAIGMKSISSINITTSCKCNFFYVMWNIFVYGLRHSS